MAKPCNQPLKANPFTADRDPNTGKWTVNKMVQQNYKPDSHLHLVQPSALINSIDVKRHPNRDTPPE